ncbi:lysM and putative peptidoglycan-binding domain-containing protein 3 [Topomyia yanbarensis]|uniref:lysM and putative peptidoglycan-binding domain-containing protein 3 n=1 Tax=Topomyia yanbarensis TaxID=2498891 RepID=UPI00273AA24A|nr:lysM and putative peptidoglycan-binding domain-containing protein 3 [Topomyia yanbarensis]
MKRQRINNGTNRVYVDPHFGNTDLDIPMGVSKSNPLDRWMEAQVLPEDTLQAIALRFNCTIAELKKINKIDKDNEIFARRVIRVPITPHSVLLDTLPKVHSSGNSSPKSVSSNTVQSSATVLEKQINLDEKLIVAAVSSASYKTNAISCEPSFDMGNSFEGTSKAFTEIDSSARQPLLCGEYDDSLPQPRPLRLPTNDFSCNGSDCDISWICLLVCILALCFAIPLVYVIYVAEHIEKYHHDSLTNETSHHKT